MSNPAALMHRLFGVPGSTPTQTDELLGRVAAVHRALLTGACSEGDAALAAALSPLEEYLEGHPFFGAMTSEEWSVLMYKHLDHHLRQFGA